MALVEFDGLLLHPSAGTLATLYADQDAARSLPYSALPIEPLLTKFEHVDVVWPHGLTKPQEYGVIIAWALRHFYIDTETERPSPQHLVAGMVSYVNSVLPADAVEEKGLLFEALRYAEIVPQWRIANPNNLDEFKTPDALRVIRMFRRDAEILFFHDRSQQLGLLGLILLVIGKSISTDLYENWVTNKLKTFRGVLGISEDNFIWSVGTAPVRRILAALSDFLRVNQPLRTRLFPVYFRAAASKRPITSQIFSTAIRLLRGSEMNHILLIDYYLFNKYPEILRLRALREELVKYNQALKYLLSVPDSERMYVKLMRPHTETNMLNKDHFMMLTSAAWAVVLYENPSFSHYTKFFSPAWDADRYDNIVMKCMLRHKQAASRHVNEVITQYLTLRSSSII